MCFLVFANADETLAVALEMFFLSDMISYRDISKTLKIVK